MLCGRLMDQLCAEFAFALNMLLVRSDLSHGIVVVVGVVDLEAVGHHGMIQHHVVQHLIRMTGASHAMKGVIIHMTAHELEEVVTLVGTEGQHLDQDQGTASEATLAARAGRCLVAVDVHQGAVHLEEADQTEKLLILQSPKSERNDYHARPLNCADFNLLKIYLFFVSVRL